MRLVDAVVDDRDLHALSCGGERGPPDLRRTDQLRRPVEQRVVGHARPDVRDPGDAGDRRHPAPGHDDREAVEDDAVAPANVGAGNRGADPRLHDTLSTIEAPEVVPARRRAEQQALRPRERGVGQRAPLGEDLGERRLLQGDEHLDIAGMCRRGERQTRQTADQETPLQVENGTAKLLSPLGEWTNLTAGRIDRSRDAWLNCSSARMWRNW